MNQYPPNSNSSASNLGPAQLDELRQIASYQRFINLAILANIIGGIAYKMMPPGLAIVAYILLLLVGLASAVATVLLAKTLHGLVVAIFCAFLAFIPCINLITLVALNQSATSRIQKAGFKVGILGADPATIR